MYYKTSLKELWFSISANQVGVVTDPIYSLLVVAHFLLLEKHGGVELFVGTSMIVFIYIAVLYDGLFTQKKKKKNCDGLADVCAYPIRKQME